MSCRAIGKGFFASVAGIGIVSTALSAQPSPEITFVSSFYQTASGAIGPQQIIATQTYRIKIDGIGEIVIDRIVAGRREFVCAPVRLEGRNHIIDFTLSVSIHQKPGGGVSYTTHLMLADDKVGSCKARDLRRNSSPGIGPAVVIYGRDDHLFYNLIRNDFDQSGSQYNK